MTHDPSTALPSGHLIVTGHLAGGDAWRLYVAVLRMMGCPAAQRMDPICTPFKESVVFLQRASRRIQRWIRRIP